MAVPELVAALDAVELGAEVAVGPAVLPELGAAVLEGVVPAEALEADVLGAEVAVLVAAVGLPAVLPELVDATELEAVGLVAAVLAAPGLVDAVLAAIELVAVVLEAGVLATELADEALVAEVLL